MANYETQVRKISESNDIANNRSTITVALEFRRTDYKYYGYNHTGDAYWYIACNGESSGNKYFTFNWEIAQWTWQRVASYTFVVPHNSDGTKTVQLAGTIYFGNGVKPGTLTASGSAQLTTIPRATTPVLKPSTVQLGESISISLSRASSSFTHRLTYKFGSLTGTISTSATTSAMLNTDISWASQIPNGNSGTGTITCDTYNGGTKIGSKTVNFIAIATDATAPSITSIQITESVAEIATKFGGYVQNQSRLSVSISAEGKYGSTIKSYSTEICDVTYSGKTFISNVIPNSGTVSVRVTVTDSRGRSTTLTRNVNVMPYTPPTLRQFVVERGNAYGESDNQGSYARITLDMDISPLNNRNDKIYKIEYKSSEDSSWRFLGKYSAYSYKGTFNGGDVLSTDFSYSARITIEDYFFKGETAVRAEIDTIGTAFTLFDVRSNGLGIAFGKVSEKNAMEIAMDLYDKEETRITNGLALYDTVMINPDTTVEHEIVTNTNTPNNQMMYVVTRFYNTKSTTTNRMQIAYPYNSSADGTYYRYYNGGSWGTWKKYFTEEDAKKCGLEDSGWQKLGAAGIYRKKNGIVTVQIDSRGEFPVKPNGYFVEVGTLPVEYRPSLLIYSSACNLGTAAFNMAIRIETDGKVGIVNMDASLTASFWTGCVSYPV